MGKPDPAQRHRRKHPDRNDDNRSNPAARTLPGLDRLGAILRHYFLRNQGHGQPDAERHDDQIVRIPDYWNEVRDKIDERQRISCDRYRENPGIPGYAGIARGEIDRMNVAYQTARPDVQDAEHGAAMMSGRSSSSSLKASSLKLAPGFGTIETKRIKRR